MRVVVLALFLAAVVLMAGYVAEKNRRVKKKRAGQHMAYEAPGKTAAACRGLLLGMTEADLFGYEIEQTQVGWYLTLRSHRPTGQVLATVFQLVFTGEDPARFTLDFISEAFGSREPVMPESMLDEFFAQKLGAVRCDTGPEGGEAAS